MSCGSRRYSKTLTTPSRSSGRTTTPRFPTPCLPLFRRRDDKNKPKIVDALLRRFADFAFKTLTADELKSAIKKKDDLDPIERDPIDTDTLEPGKLPAAGSPQRAKFPKVYTFADTLTADEQGKFQEFHSAAQRRFGRAVQDNGGPTPEQLRAGAEIPA